MMAFIDMHKLLGLPVLASEHGKDVDNFIIYVHWLMIVLFIGWLAFFLYTLVWFRRSKSPKADYVGVKNHSSSYIEGAVALVEAALLIGFAIPLWAKVVEEFPDPSKATVVRVTAEQFSWNSRYSGKDGVFGRQSPEFVAPDNKFGYDPDDPAGQDDVVPPLKDIRVPVDKPVLIYLTSLDVIHSMSIHELRVCQDAIPGMRVPVHFTPTVPGEYQITCAQLCGNAHYGMNGYFTVQTAEDYQTWLDSHAQAGAAAAGGFE